MLDYFKCMICAVKKETIDEFPFAITMLALVALLLFV